MRLEGAVAVKVPSGEIFIGVVHDDFIVATGNENDSMNAER
jgi:hypothetical protein